MPTNRKDLASHGHVSRRSLLQMALAAGAAPAFARGPGEFVASQPAFALGVASGHPRPDGMVLWTRITGERLPERVKVTWEISRDENFKKIAARGTEVAESAWAHSVHAEPLKLEPGRWYWYRFQALGQQSPVGRTRTAPAPNADAGAFNFAIASCQRWDHGYYAAWRHMAAENLDLVMFLGDYIYEYAMTRERVRAKENVHVRTLDEYRNRYEIYKGDPSLQAAHAAAPWLLMWDDHEVENNYANGQGEDFGGESFLRQRAAAYQAYWEHLPFPKAMRPKGPDMRMYGRHDWGRLARIHALDERQYRDVQACPKPEHPGGGNFVYAQDCPSLADPRRSMLGAEQERWLAEGWDLQRPWNLLANQTLMAPFAWEDPQNPASRGGSVRTDGWSGYAAARRRLLEGVAQKQVPGVVVLSGDVHANYVADLKTNFDDLHAPAIATEFCGTSITSEGPQPERVASALSFNPHIKYGRSGEHGYMRFKLDAKQLQAQIRTLDNVRDPSSGIATAARFTVDAKRPGAQPA